MDKEKIYNWITVIFFLILIIGIFVYTIPLNALPKLAYGILGIIIGIYLGRQILKASYFQYYYNQIKNQKPKELTAAGKILGVIVFYGIVILCTLIFTTTEIAMGVIIGLMMGYLSAEITYKNIDDYFLIKKKNDKDDI